MVKIICSRKGHRKNNDVLFLYPKIKRREAIMEKLNVISLFDGISCGQLALERAYPKIN